MSTAKNSVTKKLTVIALAIFTLTVVLSYLFVFRESAEHQTQPALPRVAVRYERLSPSQDGRKLVIRKRVLGLPGKKSRDELLLVAFRQADGDWREETSRIVSVSPAEVFLSPVLDWHPSGDRLLYYTQNLKTQRAILYEYATDTAQIRKVYTFEKMALHFAQYAPNNHIYLQLADEIRDVTAMPQKKWKLPEFKPHPPLQEGELVMASLNDSELPVVIGIGPDSLVAVRTLPLSMALAPRVAFFKLGARQTLWEDKCAGAIWPRPRKQRWAYIQQLVRGRAQIVSLDLNYFSAKAPKINRYRQSQSYFLPHAEDMYDLDLSPDGKSIAGSYQSEGKYYLYHQSSDSAQQGHSVLLPSVEDVTEVHWLDNDRIGFVITKAEPARNGDATLRQIMQTYSLKEKLFRVVDLPID